MGWGGGGGGLFQHLAIMRKVGRWFVRSGRWGAVLGMKRVGGALFRNEDCGGGGGGCFRHEEGGGGAV